MVKAQAVHVVEAIGTWTNGGAGADAAAARVAAAGQPGSLARQAPQLLPQAHEAAVQVIDAQYGGILATSASVLVVCRQWSASRTGAIRPSGTTVDVRLVKTGGGWRVIALHPARPGAPARHLSDLAARVLAEPRITLPPASMADIRSGQVHESVLSALLTLSRRYRIGVSVIRSGHPIYVFGTNRRSDHPRGRAFDTWRIDGRPVVHPSTPSALVIGYMESAAAAGSYNVGGPYLLSGSQFFSDATHHDHVHAGFLT